MGTPLIGTITTWLLAWTVYYLFAPLVFSLVDDLENDRGKPIFRIIFACGAVSTGLFFDNISSLPLWYICVVFAWSVVIIGYLSVIRKRRILDPYGLGGDLIEMFSGFNDGRKEMRTDFEREGAFEYLIPLIYSITFLCIFAIPFVLAGVLGPVFILAYPIPDMLVLGWAIGAFIFDRISYGPSKSKVLSTEFDFERFTLDALENGTRGPAGLLLSMLVLGGMFISASYFSLWLAVFGEINNLFFQIIGDSWRNFTNSSLTVYDFLKISINLWNLVASNIGLVSISGFAIWGWIREWQRLPHFLDYWEDRDTISGTPPQRPWGFMLLPSVGMGLFVLFLHFSLPNLLESTYLNYILAISWVALFGGMGYVGYQSFDSTTNKAQHIRYEHYWITGGLYILSLPMLLGTGFGDIIEVIFITAVLLLCLGIILTGKVASTASGLKTYLDVGFFISYGLLFVRFKSSWPKEYQNIVIILSAVLIIGGFFIGLARMYEGSQPN